MGLFDLEDISQSNPQGYAERVEAALAQPPAMLIGGAAVQAESGRSIPTFNPATGRKIAEIPNASACNIDDALQAARQAQRAWARRPYMERRALVLEAAQCLRKHAPLLGMLDSLESGNLFSAMKVDPVWAADAMEYLSSIGAEVKGEAGQLDSNLHYTRHEPYGVVLRLLPFNHPVYSAGIALAAPLLMGNSVVLKPSPHTSLSTLAYGQLLSKILPAGVLTVLTGSNEDVAIPLIRHSLVDRISLIGSSEAGKAVMKLAAERLVPLTLELGGKNPLIIFPDADLDAAADIAIQGMNFSWQSASCGSTSRILVHASVKDDFAARLAAKVGAIKPGLPTDPGSRMGAITFRELFDRCRSYVEAGKSEGAKLLVGGTIPQDPELRDGFFMTPAVFSDCTRTMRIAREEIFGPIISILGWDDYETMLDIANELDYGLTAVILSRDLDIVHRTAERLNVGYVEVNGTVSWAIGSPFGGYKQSGFGREGNIDELLSYTRTKSVNVRLSPDPRVRSS